MTLLIPYKKFWGSLFLFWILHIPDFTHARNKFEEPEFEFQLPNLNATVGSDVSFTCAIKNLTGYKIAWIRPEDKSIISWHNHMVTHNHRFSVTHRDNNIFTLHIKNVQLNDTGSYMCQVNTEPQRSQFGTLNVYDSPNINVTVTNNENAKVGESLAGVDIHQPSSASKALPRREFAPATSSSIISSIAILAIFFSQFSFN